MTASIKGIAHRRRQARAAADPSYQTRRDEILIAAARLFSEKGYKGVSTRDVAEAVGIDRASLYYYATGKHELFQEVVREAILKNVLMAEMVRDSDKSSREKLVTFVSSLMTSFAVHYPYIYVYIQEDMAKVTEKSTKWASEMKSFSRRFERAVIAIVQEGIDDGTFRANCGSARLLTFGIIGMCNWSHRWFKPNAGPSAEEVSEIFSGMILDGLVSAPS